MTTYCTDSKIVVTRNHTEVDTTTYLEQLKQDLNKVAGGIFLSNYEYPNRYTRWNIGFKNPPLVLEGYGKTFRIRILTPRGKILLTIIWDHLNHHLNHRDSFFQIKWHTDHISGQIKERKAITTESDRLSQPSLINLVKVIRNIFYSDQDNILGLYGSFGYDLVFGFEDLQTLQTRDRHQRDLVLYLPDEILVEDRLQGLAGIYTYNFIYQGKGNLQAISEAVNSEYLANLVTEDTQDWAEGQYSKQVELLKQEFKAGNMFECVLSNTYHKSYQGSPSSLFSEILNRNPAPYSFFLNLGKSEFLIGASPEMFVRVTEDRIETCPISGTISRGSNALQESENILKLLSSEKECSELVMCTDIDRNDKSRICVPGSVRVITHRQIETTSRLIHTVDHVEGYLKPEYDALDALAVHLWAVTVTGAPKKIAVDYLEKHEKSPRKWYGGAVGIVNFNGNLNTGLTLRTIHLQDGMAHLRVGATLLYDSDPELEEKETQLKASAFLDILNGAPPTLLEKPLSQKKPGKVLVIDFNDSFVHTIASYLQELVTEVDTVRYYHLTKDTNLNLYRGFVLSPGPKKPGDYPMKWLLDRLVSTQKPILGVCLGHQAIIEYYGGKTEILPEPVHGKIGELTILERTDLLSDLPKETKVARYHSLVARKTNVPDPLLVTSLLSNTDLVMSIKHLLLPIYGVQFHPESILTDRPVGFKILENFTNLFQSTDLF